MLKELEVIDLELSLSAIIYHIKKMEVFFMTIAQVSEKYNISADTLRYYEKIGLIPPVRRTTGGIRDYSSEDCGWVEFIRCMRDAGVQVEALAEYVKLFRQGDSTKEKRKNILIEQRQKLIEQLEKIQKCIERLDVKINNYDGIVVTAENKLRKGFEDGETSICEKS